MLKKEVSKSEPSVDVVKLQKSGGVVNRNAKYRQRARSYRIRVSILVQLRLSLILAKCTLLFIIKVIESEK